MFNCVLDTLWNTVSYCLLKPNYWTFISNIFQIHFTEILLACIDVVDLILIRVGFLGFSFGGGVGGVGGVGSKTNPCFFVSKTCYSYTRNCKFGTYMETYVVLENIFFSTKTSSILLMSLLMSAFFTKGQPFWQK